MIGSLLSLSFGVVIAALLSEDAALLGSLALYKQGSLPLSLACAAPMVGIIAGDLGLYFIGLSLGKLTLSNPRRASPRSNWMLFAARFIPGTRLPAYLGAGVLQLPAIAFASITALSTLIWVALSALLVTHTFRSIDVKWLWAIAGGVALTSLTIGQFIKRPENGYRVRTALRLRTIANQIFKLQYYEFWPAWLFYIPVGAYYFLIALKNRSFALPLYANPGIPNAGIIGESKSFILSLVPDGFSEKLRYLKISPANGSAETRLEQVKAFLAENQINFPLILKPDVGQRGSGVVLVDSLAQLKYQLGDLRFDVILQEYCAYSEEIGVNYLRWPGETRGKITGITRKRFPSVLGDGKRLLAELILDDARARYLTPLYFSKHAARVNEVIPKGETYLLARIGNHCQGTIFEDGMSLASPGLETHLDQIAQSMPGFFVGRFDIRFESEASLRLGAQLKIIEINGAAGEATHIYDRKTGLIRSYATLFEQLRILFKLGSQNKRTHREVKTRFWRDLLQYRELSKQHPNTT